MKQRRLFAGLTITLCVVVFGGLLLACALQVPVLPLSPQVARRQANITRGGEIAVAGDCIACHTRGGGAPFAGGAPFRLPFGTVYSSNITPDPKFGIGGYRLDQFIRLMREGVAGDGHRIYPAMPYTSFAKVSDLDLQDLFAWLSTQVRPVAEARRTDGIIWPLSIRWPLAIWNKFYLDDRPFQYDSRASATENRGAYLVQGLGHCGTCHTPRGAAVAEKATREDGRWYLAGAELDGQSSSDLRADSPLGLKEWSERDIVELLKTARTAHTAVAGQMSEVVVHSTQNMPDSDLRAIAAYLKSLGPSRAQRAYYQPSETTYQSYLAGREQSSGARKYMDSCAACHRLDGEGYEYAFPRLAGNATVLHDSPDSLVAVIVAGARLPSTADEPSPMAMPAFGWRYTDPEIADLANFVRTAWGNHAEPVSASQVRRIRSLALDEGSRNQ